MIEMTGKFSWGHPGKALERDDGVCELPSRITEHLGWGSCAHPRKRPVSQPSMACCDCGLSPPQARPGFFFLDCFVFPSSPGLLPSPALSSSLFTPLSENLTI